MANQSKVGLKIEIDGEKEYKQAISELNRDNAVLSSELRKVSEQYKGNEDSIEALTAKARIYADQLDTQVRKVEETRERYNAWQAKLEDVRKTFGATSDEYQQAQKQVAEYAIKLNNAEREQAKLENALEETNKALNSQGEDLKCLGDGLDEIAGKFGVDIPDAAKNALNGMGDFSAGTVASMAGAAGAIAAVAKVGKELFDLTVEAASQADALLTRSAQTGIDTSTLQGLDYASRFLDFEGLDKTLAKFTQSMAAANEGTKAQADAFGALGISITDADGKLLNNYETFLQAIDALSKIENATERDALANDLFGKSYADMKPLIDAGTGALQAYIQEAERLGYVIDEETVQKLGALDDAMQKNEASSTALKNTVAGELAPTFTTLVDAATAAQDGLNGLLQSDFFSGALSFTESSTFLGSLIVNITSLSNLIQGLRGDVDEAAPAITESVDNSVSAQQQAMEAISGDLEELRKQYDAAYDSALSSLNGQFGLWEQAGEVTATSTTDMLAGLQSQIDYWNEYESNFDALISRNIDGIEEFAKKFDDGSLASAQALAGLKNATDEEIQQIIAKMDETKEAKEGIAQKFAELETDVSGSLDQIKDKYAETVENINTETGNIDFAPFEDAVNTAFSNLEYRVDTAVEYATARLQELFDAANMEINPQINQSTIVTDTNADYNAAGDRNWRGGLTWVGEGGPELVSLPRGSQIYSSQESAQMAAAVGSDTGALERIMSENTAMLRGILAELSGMQIRGRMYG